MDTLFHGLLGAVLCSRTGLPGGRRGPVDGATGRRKICESTFWVALFFGTFPDVFSLGLWFAWSVLRGDGLAWRGIPEWIFSIYHFTHSLTGMAVGLGVVALWKRRWFLPALAWPLHVLCDVPTHGSGVFTTPLLWPFSNWGVHGWNWWMYPWMSRMAWGLLLLLWLGVAVARISWKRADR